MGYARNGSGQFFVCYTAKDARSMLDCLRPRWEGTTKYYNWSRENLHLFRITLPPVNAFAKPRAVAWVLTYDCGMAEVWDPHISDCKEHAEEIQEAEL